MYLMGLEAAQIITVGRDFKTPRHAYQSNKVERRLVPRPACQANFEPGFKPGATPSVVD